MRRFLRNLNGASRRINRALTLTNPTASATTLTLESTDPGATGPVLQFYHNTATPAVNDVSGSIDFYSNNSGGTKVRFGAIECVAASITAGAENSKFVFKSMEAGVEQTVLTVGQGLIVGNPAGGDPGYSKVNATEYQSGGVILPNSLSYTSAQQTISNAGLLTLAHGLGVVPRLVRCYAVCLITEGNWSVNDTCEMPPGGGGFVIYVDATNIYVRYNNAVNPCQTLNKTTGAAFSMTNANWRLIFQAYN